MANPYQAHAGPSYYMQPPQSPINNGQNYPAQNYYGPGPSAGPPPNGVYPSHQYTPVPHAPHPGMSSPRLNGGRGTGGAAYNNNNANNNVNNNPQSSRGPHGSYAHAHANYRPPYSHPPYPPPPPNKYPQPPPPQGYPQYPPNMNGYAPPPQWAGQQLPPQQQQQQLSPLPIPDIPLGPPPPPQDPSYYPPNQHHIPPRTNDELTPAAPAPAPSTPPRQTRPFTLTTLTAIPPHLATPSSILSPLSAMGTPPPVHAHVPPVSPTISATRLPQTTFAPTTIIVYPESETTPTTIAHAPDPESTSPIGSGGWAIWSRRPHNPAHAPGVIISPRARPPAVVLANAREGGTPPPSPPPVVVHPAAGSKEPEEKEKEANEEEKEEESVREAKESTPEADVEVPSSGTSTADNTDTRTTVSPTTAATTMPGSPVSSVAAVPSAAKTAVVAEVPGEKSVDSTTTADGAAESTSDGSTAAATAISPPPAAAPAPAPAAPPAKKSWASLLRPAPAPSSSSSPSSASPASTTASPQGQGPQKPKFNGLPTSSVVGFSIPAGLVTDNGKDSEKDKSSGISGVNAANRATLLALLTNPPPPPSASTFADTTVRSFASASASAVKKQDADADENEKKERERIIPRGLINTGNMCFANAVLQVLLYCAPFAGLFSRMGALLGEAEFDVSSGGNNNANANAFPLPGAAGAAAEADDGAGGLGGANGGAAGIVGTAAGGGGVLAAAPLVRATGAFLKEFVVTPKPTPTPAGAGTAKGKAKAEERAEEPEAFIPTYVYDALKGKKRFDGMRGGQQEDAEEFLGFFLDTLEEELLAVVAALSPPAAASKRPNNANNANGGSGRAVVEEHEEEAPPETDDGWLEVGKKNRTVVTRTIKTAESPITRIFGGKFRSTLRAPGQKDSVIVEDWRSLRLDIQRDGIHTIPDALAFISHPQNVQLTQPSRPGIVVDASQQVLIEALPPILILHVKRFCYDTEVGGVVKVGKQVAFGPELDVMSDVMVPAARKQPAKYKLFGVIYHHGLSASGGHYTLDILHPTRFPGTSTGSEREREGWIRIDDELVSDVRPMDVFGGASDGDTRCAYLLFYRRIR
ncbi:cysteine proteinase [Favolaschia claudopus]|uniref:ubiquitinyl hydrolase 1 n=1 Tax=Favolaschia claudopus TaxID=2862362 RepID=A0AAW0B422_9AGAR